MPAYFTVKAMPSTGLAIFFVCLLGACAVAPPANVPAAIYEACQREISLLTRAEPGPDNPMLETPSEQAVEQTIEDARMAKADARLGGLSQWPEEALLVRCYAANEVQLTSDQAALLATWRDHDKRLIDAE